MNNRPLISPNSEESLEEYDSATSIDSDSEECQSLAISNLTKFCKSVAKTLEDNGLKLGNAMLNLEKKIEVLLKKTKNIHPKFYKNLLLKQNILNGINISSGKEYDFFRIRISEIKNTIYKFKETTINSDQNYSQVALQNIQNEIEEINVLQHNIIEDFKKDLKRIDSHIRIQISSEVKVALQFIKNHINFFDIMMNEQKKMVIIMNNAGYSAEEIFKLSPLIKNINAAFRQNSYSFFNWEIINSFTKAINAIIYEENDAPMKYLLKNHIGLRVSLLVDKHAEESDITLKAFYRPKNNRQSRPQL